MIDLRYHIVSLVAVFLALALGILLGSSVVSTPLEARLHDDLRRANEQRDAARREATQIDRRHRALLNRVDAEIGPWAQNGRLRDLPVVMVSDGEEPPAWRRHVLDAILAAGADPAGTLILGERFELAAPSDAEELIRTVTSIVPTFEGGTAPGGAALALLAERFAEPTGRALIEALAEEGFVRIEDAPGGEWPPAGSTVAMLSPARMGEQAPVQGSAIFARNVAGVTPTIVVSDKATGRSVVTQLRDEEDLPDDLATFDSATTEADPGGVGVVAAFVAAAQGRGGHFGSGEGLRFVAPPAPPQ